MSVPLYPGRAKTCRATALVLALATPAVPAPRTKQPRPQVPLELKLFGTAFIPKGQQVKYKAMLTNRPSPPIVLASNDSTLDFRLNWTISDSSGRELRRLPLLYCRVGGRGWYKDLTRRMKDSEVTILKPGERL